MKKQILFPILLTLLLSTPCVLAESWDDYADLDRAWDGQKTITNKEFEQVMDALQEKQKKKEARQKKKQAKKISGGGTSLHTELNPDKEIREINLSDTTKEGILLNLPVCITIDGQELDKGYYQVFAERSPDKKIYINFYQSQYLKGKIEAEETEDDFGQEEVNFAQIIPFNERFVKIIFGCIDFNAFSYVPYKE